MQCEIEHSYLFFVIQVFYFVSTSHEYVLCQELSLFTELFVQLLYSDNHLKIMIESS